VLYLAFGRLTTLGTFPYPDVITDGTQLWIQAYVHAKTKLKPLLQALGRGLIQPFSALKPPNLTP
jgi:hypothetical protein